MVGDHVVDAHDRAPPHHPHRVDERVRRERAVVGGGAAAGDPGDERAAVDGARRRADDQVEARRQPEALQRRGHAGRDDAAHAPAFEHECHPVRVAARARRRPPGGALPKDSDDGVRRVGLGGGLDMHEQDDIKQDDPAALRPTRR